ncbi:hypothetical protein SETIT_8G171900v2 [Setaria italica]|uniref:non-specific serine/threonine protein kinase n=2 Tax=Setaria italica TaxID=4555 RepID=A0A368S8Q8_SETIT|nr:uncharacterized protein LOC101778754 isoform X3 [Setaria italica]RCV38807.1 hypothetical protein SETIT_8G171900v2 [Setaria italica]
MLRELEKIRPGPENATGASQEEPSKSWVQLEARNELDQARSGPEDGTGGPSEGLSLSVLEQPEQQIRSIPEDGAGGDAAVPEHQSRPEDDDAAVPFVRMETQEVAAGPSGGPLASLQIEAARHIHSGPYQDGARPSNPFPSLQPQDREILQQLEQIRLNGDVDEQSSPEWTRQPADIFQERHIAMDHSSSGSPRKIPFHLLQEITDCFSDERKLGSGGFGKVYMGVHNDGEKIAVKMLHYMLGFEEEQFLKEFNNLARLQHPNIVRLVGYCYDVQKNIVEYEGRLVFAERIYRALCFEYMHHGSLDKYVSDEYPGLDWNTRYTLIKGICKGLEYLHEELKPPMYHLDLKPANILLGKNMLPKIADFGLSRFFGEEQTHITKSSIGTRGYLPPEYIERNIVSRKFDIFSLGVIIIKIMTGPTGYRESAEMSPQEFIDFAHKNWRTRLQATPMHLFESYSKQVKRCMEIALSCVEVNRHKRPSIREIVKQLNETEIMIHKQLNEKEIMIYRTRLRDLSSYDQGSSMDQESETIGLCREASCNSRGVIRQGMSTTKVGCVGNYELGRTIGKGTFAKFKFARNIHTGEFVAIKILDKEKVLKHKMVEQIKRGILAMKLIEHPNVVRIYEVMGSKTKIYIVLECVPYGDLLDTIVNSGRMRECEARRYFQQLINAVDYCHSRDVYHLNLKPEKLLLDSRGNLKVSEFGLGALSQQIKTDGVLHTTYGTPNYVAPEVLEDGGYDSGTADVWSCGVILFVLLAGYLPFEDSNLTRLYKKRITIPEILEDEWFKEGYRRQEFDKKFDITLLDDVDAVFQDSEEHLVTEKKDEPVSLNAFDLISSSKGFNLENLLDSEQGFKREERFTSTCPPREIIHRIEEAATTLGFSVQKKNYKLRLEKIEAGRKGNLHVAAEILQIAPSFHVIEVRKGEGDTLEFHKFYKDLSKTLKDIVWKFDDL